MQEPQEPVGHAIAKPSDGLGAPVVTQRQPYDDSGDDDDDHSERGKSERPGRSPPVNSTRVTATIGNAN